MFKHSSNIKIEHNQNYLHLASIQSVSLGLGVIAIGKLLAEQYGTGISICSILVGNLILWLIAITIISMAFEHRSNSIQNVSNYLGKYGALFMWGTLIIAFLNWFVFQINTTLPSIETYFTITNPNTLLRLGAGLGFLTALISCGGITLIKKVTVTSLPIILGYYIYAISQTDYSFSAIDHWGLSLPAIITTVSVLLPGVVNLPTFFRHAQSKVNCYLALTIMTILISFFEISTIWMKFTYTGNYILSILTLCFIVFTLICTNLLNIYFASACWEGFIPQFEGAKGYAITGLLGTVAYTFIQISSPLIFLGNLTNSFIASLGIVLLIAFLMQLIIKHRPRPLEKLINSFCWLIGCIVSTILTIQDATDSVTPLLAGITASAAAFVCILFVEENVWAIRKVLANK